MRRFVLTMALGLGGLAACSPARAQGPVAGQLYQVPAGYESYGPGTLINYGGYNYVIQGNGTMVLSQPTTYTSYYNPPGYTPYYPQTTYNYAYAYPQPGYWGYPYWRRPGPGGPWAPGGPWPPRGRWRPGMMGQPVFDPGIPGLMVD